MHEQGKTVQMVVRETRLKFVGPHKFSPAHFQTDQLTVFFLRSKKSEYSDTSSSNSATALKDQQLAKQSTVDSNGSDSSSVKILINDKEEDEKARPHSNHNESNDTGDEVKDELNEPEKDDANSEENVERAANASPQQEQRSSVIVQPSRIPVRTETVKLNATDHKVEQQPPKDSKPKFLFESKLSSTLVNSLFNSANQEAAAKLRPSVLRINEAASATNEKNENDSPDNEEKSSKDGAATATSEPAVKPATSLFKFAPLTDNKKSIFGSSFGSSITSSSCVLASSSSLSGLSSTNKSSSGTPSFLTNNGDKPTNYFTENLFQVAAQSTSNNSPESSTFSIASSNSESAGFVFGQNLQDRVTNIVEKTKPSTASTAGDPNESSTSLSDDLKPGAAATPANSQLASGSGTSEKRKFENITGEEEETNVVHIYCKLFHWDSDQSAWKERGKGNLRLNDKYDEERTSSRLIMRTAGSLKLILNCLIISGMKFELTNDSKCLRFSNVDGIYLIKGKQMDIEQIYSLIEQRLRLLPKKSRAELKQIDEDEHLNRDQIEKLRLNKDDDEESLVNTSNTSDGKPGETSFKSFDTSANPDEQDEKAEDNGDGKSEAVQNTEEEKEEGEANDEHDAPEESDSKDETGKTQK